MKNIKIIINEDNENDIAYLQTLITQNLKNKVELEIIKTKRNIQFIIKSENTYKSISYIIANYIIEIKEDKLIKHYLSLQSDDIEEFSNSITIINNIKNITRTNREKNLIKDIMEVINNNQEIHIEGLIQFRLTRYKKTILNLIEESIDKFYAELHLKEMKDLL